VSGLKLLPFVSIDLFEVAKLNEPSASRVASTVVW
jgi:hypothetical protein